MAFVRFGLNWQRGVGEVCLGTRNDDSFLMRAAVVSDGADAHYTAV